MRKKWIDTGKGIAILLVILAHVNKHFSFAYGIHLVMFFLLSGYTLKQKELNREYAAGKFRRLMTPYFFTCAAILLMDIVNSAVFSRDIRTLRISEIVSGDLIRSFFASGSIQKFGSIDLGGRIGAIWFLPALFFGHLILQALLRFTRDLGKLGAATAIIAMAGYVSARYLWLPFSVQSGMFASFFLWMGYAIRERGLLERVRWPHYLIAQGLMIAGALLGYSNVAFVTAKASDLLLSTVVGLSGCLLMYGISVLLKKGRLLSGLGQISLTVLCTHLFSLETMGAYYTHLLNRIGLQGEVRLWAATALQILFALGTAVLLEGLRRVLLPVNRRMLQLAKARRQQAGGGMEAVWIDAGILALLALMLHMGADPWLSKCIRSCCAVSFVFLAGYRYEKERPLACLGRDAARYLLPYALAAAAQLLIPALRAGTPRGWLLGMTGADQLLTETPAVGVPGLLLPLFLICALYRGLDLLLPRPEYRAVAVICLSASGRLLGHYGYWLPWSLDIACFGLVFFWLGTLCRQYHLLRKLRDNAWMYFALTPVWAYMIRAKDLQITQRIYLTYGMTVLGAMAGALAVYQLAAYILRAMPVTAAAFGRIGRAALPLLVVHTLFSQPLQRALSVHMDAEKLPYFLSLLGIQLLAAVLIAAALRLLTRRRASSQQTNKPTNKE